MGRIEEEENMKMFSDCSNECCVCAFSGGTCLAGHGDDDFVPASKEELLRRLQFCEDKRSRQHIIDFLKDYYNYEFH